jgi:ectoine hydroxylase-related dioxygenase (phytanoyl-CoA dioxygenase family)
MTETQPYPEANDALGHPDELRARMERDGCLFFRRLVDPEALLAVRRDILQLCREAGWLAESSELMEGVAAPGVRHVEPEPDYMVVYDQVMRLESFHALAHDPALLAMYRDLMGEPVLVHPRNIARIIFPRNTKYTTPAHQDYIHIQGTPETFTAWIPLGDCPREFGSLSILAGSHRKGLLPTHAAYGAGGRGVETDDLGLPWLEGDFRLGDSVIFHSHAVHRALDNTTSDRLRLSVDFRYQGVSQPVVEGSLLPHFARLTWDEIYTGWSSERYQYYWRDLPLNVAPFDRSLYARLDAGSAKDPKA